MVAIFEKEEVLLASSTSLVKFYYCVVLRSTRCVYIYIMYTPECISLVREGLLPVEA